MLRGIRSTHLSGMQALVFFPNLVLAESMDVLAHLSSVQPFDFPTLLKAGLPLRSVRIFI